MCTFYSPIEFVRGSAQIDTRGPSGLTVQLRGMAGGGANQKDNGAGGGRERERKALLSCLICGNALTDVCGMGGRKELVWRLGSHVGQQRKCIF